MPNHVHGIIWIAAAKAVGAQHLRNPASFHGGEAPAPPGRAVAGGAAPLPSMVVAPGSLGAVVRSFKSVTTKRINAIRGTPGAPVWQRNYYEHIVRNEADLQRIRQYIRDNPLMWAEDPDNPKNVR